MRVRVEVTARDIKLGVRGNGLNCPVARACKRAGFRDVEVMPFGGITFRAAACACVIPRVRAFVQDFDCEVPVKPFSFTLNVPASAVKR